MIWSTTSGYKMRDLEYLGGESAVKQLWQLVIEKEGQVCMVHPYNPIFNIKRTDTAFTFETLTNGYKDREMWLERLMTKYPKIKEELPIETRVFFGEELFLLSAKRDGKPLRSAQMGALAKEANLELSYHILGARGVVSKALQIFNSTDELDQQRIVFYPTGEKPFHISKYALPEFLILGFENYLYDLAIVELKHLEKVFWYVVRSTSHEWFKMTEDLDISCKDLRKMQDLAGDLLGVK